jgi:nucleoside-diphosphate-sugar epimerase
MIKILGSRGFIGSELLAYIEKIGYEVEGVTEDIRDKEKLSPHLKDSEFIINAVGETKEQQNEELCHATNVLGTKNVVELCIEHDCKLIHLSSTARKTAYGRSKQESQKVVEEAKGLRAVILRLCPIVKLDDPLMIWGKRYPIEELVKDIEFIIGTHNFKEVELIDYKDEKSTDIYKSRTQVFTRV